MNRREGVIWFASGVWAAVVVAYLAMVVMAARQNRRVPVPKAFVEAWR
jgi:hypothetical protein